ncbi:MAG: hypothetical protein Q8927_06735 [Bacteroidota bacterium]|nr:hypothetical protein [Bacteroidota bacterium]MDP4215880.1 hypothetical protein [Bacteroidota bacterium]MDP4246797.1 hypothetical protein [Bacteroidota bacterium]MDP4254128.1 hypothetical protein [Bacteroidota bacterium]MDP4258385.1 hypothetical protein [Bacteroidota bacterium]
MKKINFLIIVAFGILACTEHSTAQQNKLTPGTATRKAGYTVLNPNETIKIYKYVHYAHAPKVADQYAPKYYFAKDSSDVLQLLTKENLKRAFPDNHRFHDALDATFREDKELVNYDGFHKMYKVNHLLEMSTKP